MRGRWALACVLVLVLLAGLVGGAAAAAPASSGIRLLGHLDAGTPEGAVAAVDARVVDSLGDAHTVTFRFIRSGGDAWDWDATTLDPGVFSPNPLAAGTITFEPGGRAQTAPGDPEGFLFLQFVDGADDAEVRLDMEGLHQRAGASALRAVSTPGGRT